MLLALLSAGLLTLAFPDFELWFLAWFALVPLMWAVTREGSVGRSFLIGWLFGTAYFFGTCWWLTYAPIHYASIPWPIAYLLILIACLGAGVFPGVFASILSRLLKRFGSSAFLAVPFVWVFTEFARYWLTGNNWSAIGYSQAFTKTTQRFAEYGGVEFVGFLILIPCVAILTWIYRPRRYFSPCLAVLTIILASDLNTIGELRNLNIFEERYLYHNPMRPLVATVIAVQPNIPMSGMNAARLEEFRGQQIKAAQENIGSPKVPGWPTVVILPESPMNFMYNDDREFQRFVREFTTKNNVSLLFNSAEPDATNGKYFNSAVMVGSDGNKAAEYDKVYLLPFGEAVPVPLDSIMPAFVGSFSYGRGFPLLPVGDAKAGVMICFESHFGALGREYVKSGADVLIEMTNDGYLGPTPVLRQHLANAVFRAVETNRPVLRVTNVGITTYIDQLGNVIDPAPTYTEATRVWSIAKSDGSQTLYVRYGDWFAWLCTVVTIGLVVLSFRKRRSGITES